MMDDDYEELMMMTGPTCFFSHAGRWNLRDAGKNCDPQNLHGTALPAARGLNMINQTVTEASESGMCGRLLLEKWADGEKEGLLGDKIFAKIEWKDTSKNPTGVKTTPSRNN